MVLGLRLAAFVFAAAFLSVSACARERIDLARKAGAADVPFELIDNRIFVETRINGQGPYQFIFDTGGQNILDTGVARDFDGDPDMPLLWFLREDLKLKGAKPGCLIAQCGACTVHVNGEAMRSCSLPLGTLTDARIDTVEALSTNGSHPVQRAWIEEDVAQCGYCQTGQIMAVVALLKAKPKPTDADIDEALTNLCRCGTYNRIRKAVHRAAALMAEGK